MNPNEISTILVEAATFLKDPIRDTVALAVKETFERVKTYLLERFGSHSSGEKALEMASEKPESAARRSLLTEELKAAGLNDDEELSKLIGQLAACLCGRREVISQSIRVTGQENFVQVSIAGRDLVITEKTIHRNVITPDERHINQAQRELLRSEIASLAERLGTEHGKPNFAGVHHMLQRRYGIASYVLLPKQNFEDAVNYLKQQRAIFRSHLLQRNPTAFRNEFYCAIYAAARELGWSHQQVYQFAAQKLGLTRPLSSLKELGCGQLKSLAAHVRQAVRNLRTTD